MTTVAERQQAIVEEFEGLPNWEEKYKRIIQIGRELPDLPEEKRLEKYKVKGCQSQVWLLADLDQDGNIQYEADSDAMIVRGLVSILMRVYSEAPPSEVLSTPPDFLKDAGFATHLSPSRSNGLFSMVEQIKLYALVLDAKLKAQ